MNTGFILYEEPIDTEDTFDRLNQDRCRSKEKALNRRKRDIKKKRDLVYKLKKYGRSYNYPSENESYIRRAKNSNNQKFFKTLTHKKNRKKHIHEEDHAQKGNHYRKTFDYHWELD